MIAKNLAKEEKPRSIDLHGKLFFPRYSHQIIKGLVRPHRPALSKKIKPASYGVRLRYRDLKNWSRFVKSDSVNINSPLTYYNSAGAFALFDLLSQLRINFSTILHLRAEIDFIKKNLDAAPGQEYVLKMSLADIILKEKQCILVMETLVTSGDGELVRLHRDFWFVKKCDPKFLKDLVYPCKYDVNDFKGLTKLDPSFVHKDRSQLEVHEIFIGRNAGNSFARVSGDYNVIHTTHWGARLCGQKRPFLQGFGILNLCLHKISTTCDVDLAKISLTFCRPALVKQSIELLRFGNDFELVDNRGKLVAFGSIA